MSRLTVAEISTVVSLRWGDGNKNNSFQATWQQPSKIILILSVLQVNNLKIFSFKHTLCNVFALFDCHGPVVHFLATDTFNISPTIPSGFGSNVTNALFLKNCRIGCLHDDHHHYKNRGRFTYWNITFYSAPKYL